MTRVNRRVCHGAAAFSVYDARCIYSRSSLVSQSGRCCASYFNHLFHILGEVKEGKERKNPLWRFA